MTNEVTNEQPNGVAMSLERIEGLLDAAQDEISKIVIPPYKPGAIHLQCNIVHRLRDIQDEKIQDLKRILNDGG